MNQYTIIPCPENMDWDKVPKLEMTNQLHPSQQHHVRAWAQICYDDKALHVRLTAQEPYIRAEHTGLLDEICEDSCLELFFCPQMGDDRYFNLEVNPNNAVYLGFGDSLENLQRLIPETKRIFPKATLTEDGWYVEYEFPYDYIRLFFPGFSPAPGKAMKANCYKCAELSAEPHSLCWNFVPEERQTFHCPEYFGLMTFA